MVELRQISLDAVRSLTDRPLLHIKTEEDVDAWKTTTSYRDYSIFLQRLTNSVSGCLLPWSTDSLAQGTVQMLALLERLDQWIEETPPLQSPQRFGNLAFRTWGTRLEEKCEELLEELLGENYRPILQFAKPYLMSSFGSFTRMDYGTGHETSFALFLLVLTLVRFFDPVPEVERQLVLVVFLRYLRLCWKLQDVYRLEPAGSHGVWGLDDSHFLPYIFGSSQLRGHTDIPVNAVLQTPLPDTNLYFLSISRIHMVKTGPFHEHSSSLHAIAVGVPNWGKVNSGLFKMYEAEVLSKRVVVQHIPLGGILEWDPSETRSEHIRDAQNSLHSRMPPPSALPPISQTRRASTGIGVSQRSAAPVGTQAPWASSASQGANAMIPSGDPTGAGPSRLASRPIPSTAIPSAALPRPPTDSGHK